MTGGDVGLFDGGRWPLALAGTFEVLVIDVS